MAWEFIQPLELETWIIQIFSGSANVFLAIALLVISGLAGYFRMNTLALFLVISMFLLMFSGFVSSAMLVFIAVMGGLLIGLVISKIFDS